MSSMGRRTSGTGLPSLPGMVRPASSPPNTGCRPSAAVTQALPSASTRATGNWLASTACGWWNHQRKAGRTASSITIAKPMISVSVTDQAIYGHHRPGSGPDPPQPHRAPFLPATGGRNGHRGLW